MRRVQGERLIGQRLSFQPIGFYNGIRVLDQGIGQNGAGERIVLIQFVGFAQQLNTFGGFLLREQFLAFRDQTVGFGIALDAIVGELFQFGQLRIVVIGEFGGCASQQIQGARVVARMQTGVDLLNEPRFGFGAGLLVASFLQALSPRRSNLGYRMLMLRRLTICRTSQQLILCVKRGFSWRTPLFGLPENLTRLAGKE
jgi:hypothetical protein